MSVNFRSSQFSESGDFDQRQIICRLFRAFWSWSSTFTGTPDRNIFSWLQMSQNIFWQYLQSKIMKIFLETNFLDTLPGTIDPYFVAQIL